MNDEILRWRCPNCGTFNTSTLAEVAAINEPETCQGCNSEIKLGLAVTVISATIVKHGVKTDAT